MRGGARWEAVIDLRLGDCLATLRAMPDASVDSVVTDPPYGLGKEPKARDVLRAWLDGEEFKPGGAGFMGKAWDAFVPSPLVWAECLRVLKPGGHLVAFAGSRTYDWIVMGVRLAGLEVRDQLIWVYGSGMAKGYNLRRMPDSDFCHCATDGESLPSDHGKQKTEYGVRPLRDANLSTPLDAGEAGGQVLLSGVPQSGAPELRATRAEPEASAGEQPRMEGGRLHGAGEGLPDDTATGTPEGAAERLRLGTHPSGRGDARATAGPAGSGPPHQPREGRQPAGEPEGLRDAPGTLGRAPHAGLHRCQECGGLDESYRGYGTGAKPSHEPIVLARKPLSGTVAANVLEHGTGAINVDGCRVGTDGGTAKADTSATTNTVTAYGNGLNGGGVVDIDKGRWPANILHDGSPEVLAVFPETTSGPTGTAFADGPIYGSGLDNVPRGHSDRGSAARYFYSAKASRAERELGLADFTAVSGGAVTGRKAGSIGAAGGYAGTTESKRRNVHPTVKPVAVMRWLARLVTPPGGVVLDPYSGSGTTGVAAMLEGFDFIGCELSPEYVEIARARIAHARKFPAMWEPGYVAPDEVPDEQLDLFGS